jgi:hypothetical protein
MKKAAIGMFILLLTSMLALAQQEKPPVVATPTNTLNAEERLRFATSTGAYPVTPGDVYKLTFQQEPFQRFSARGWHAGWQGSEEEYASP